MNTTIDQWEVLEAVVQLGSFAAAASKMSRSPSTISYTISRLQDQFKIPLLEMKGRKTELTPAGRILLAGVEPLLAGFRELERMGASLADGSEPEINLSVDSLFPSDRLFAALADLVGLYPQAHVNLHRGPFLSSVLEFASYSADMYIGGTPNHGHLIKPILDIRMIAVARANHPLASEKRPLTQLDLTRSLAVIIEGDIGQHPGRQPHANSQRYLAVTSIESAIDAVRSGMCFGWIPSYRIRTYLESGELIELRLPMGGERFCRLFLALRDFDAASEKINHVADLLGANREVEVL